jgi:Methyltransferase domain
MECKICRHETDFLWKARTLGKYEIAYFKCPFCAFIQTEQAYWLAEAYAGAIADTDIGYVTRNLLYSGWVDRIARLSFPDVRRFLDYGGGYGLFVRLMRDRGFEFYRQDLYCENIFARGLDVEDLRSAGDQGRFGLLTAFEVFEHLDDPRAELDRMFGYADSILFSTELQPRHPLKGIDDWWYFAPHMGQHVALYSLRTLEVIAELYGCRIYSDGRSLHLLTRKKLSFNTVKWVSLTGRAADKILGRNFQHRKSLLTRDLERIQQEKH